MVSYEKVRRSLRTATITIIVLNSLSLVFRLFTGISVQLAKTEINKGTQVIFLKNISKQS